MGRALSIDEEVARRIVERHLGLPVHQHDDNSSAGMYDLRIGPADAPVLAIEVASSIDQTAAETWSLVQAVRSRRYPGVRHRWIAFIHPDANIKRIVQKLVGILVDLENRGGSRASGARNLTSSELVALGILGVGVDEGGEPGTVNMGIHRSLEIPEPEADDIPEGGLNYSNTVVRWLNNYVADKSRADNARKVAASGAESRELFVFTHPFTTGPYIDGYMNEYPGKPTIPPLLPVGVTGVWLVARIWGMRWTRGTGWQLFPGSAQIVAAEHRRRGPASERLARVTLREHT